MYPILTILTIGSSSYIHTVLMIPSYAKAADKPTCAAGTDGVPKQMTLVLGYPTYISDSITYSSKTSLAASHYVFNLSMLFKKWILFLLVVVALTPHFVSVV